MNKYFSFVFLFAFFQLFIITGCDKDSDGSDSLCENNGGDVDKDGFCADIDCDDLNQEIFIGAICDDNDDNTIDDKYNANCECEGRKIETFTDSRDNRTYKTFSVDTESGERRVVQVWFAENLAFDAENSWCYEDDAENCAVYGKLYDWQAAMTACPDGWHLPSDAEWTVLREYLGGLFSGGKMKEAGIKHWESPNTGATNSSHFTGLPGGIRGTDGSFDFIRRVGYWWSSTADNSVFAKARYLEYDNDAVVGSEENKELGFSCRCVKD